MSISGARNLTAGENVSLNCSTDIDEDRSMIEWIRRHPGNTTLVTSTGGGAVLNLIPVIPSMHEVTYTCKSTSIYGVQRRNVTVQVEGRIAT